MSARWIVAGALALIASPLAAQEQSTAESLADQFEYALVAGDYRVLPLTEDFTYTENGARLDPWDGMWRTLSALEGSNPALYPELDYRVELVDGDTVVRVVEFDENTVQGVMAYRLTARDGKIASVSVLPIREEFGGDRGGTLTLLQPMLPLTMDGELVGPADTAFTREERTNLTGGGIEAAMRTHFRDTAQPGAVHSAPMSRYTPDCVRVDNGHPATGVADSPILDSAVPEFRPYALGCADQMASRFYGNFDYGRVETFADRTRGLGIAFVRLDQPGTVLSFEAPGHGIINYPGPRGAVADADTGEQFDGRVLTNMISPMSVNGVYLFKFEDGGRISRIDAFYRGAPLGWDAVPE